MAGRGIQKLVSHAGLSLSSSHAFSLEMCRGSSDRCGQPALDAASWSRRMTGIHRSVSHSSGAGEGVQLQLLHV
eukprot:355468-Chlamydomonas_euryale.AAC.1